MGDGESMEGNVWEALNFAGFYKLDNLVSISLNLFQFCHKKTKFVLWKSFVSNTKVETNKTFKNFSFLWAGVPYYANNFNILCLNFKDKALLD